MLTSVRSRKPTNESTCSATFGHSMHTARKSALLMNSSTESCIASVEAG